MDIKALEHVPKNDVALNNKIKTDSYSSNKNEVDTSTFLNEDAVKLNFSSESKVKEKGETFKEAEGEELHKYKEALEELAGELKKKLNATKEVRFDVSLIKDDDSSKNDLKFQVVEKDTGKVVREFPPEKILNHIKDNQKSLAGLFFKDKA